MTATPTPIKVLLVKMSSMGDIFHTFAAISDLKSQHPNIEISWVVEESFAEIVAWHPDVTQVIPIALRRWMKARNKNSWQEFIAWRKQLREDSYDLVIDAQGLLKSGLIANMARSKSIHGFDKQSAREPIACFFYAQQYAVSKDQHAVTRTRQLLAQIFNYTITPALNFGIAKNFAHISKNPRKLLFIIGTSWSTKLWNRSHWQDLAKIAIRKGFTLEIIWGSKEEQAIAQSIIDACPEATRPPERMSITCIAEKLVEAAGIVGLDTGFSHLAGALETPTIALYGATSPIKVGLIGQHTKNLQLTNPLPCMPCHKRQCQLLEDQQQTPPCMLGITPTQVWSALAALLPITNTHEKTE